MCLVLLLTRPESAMLQGCVDQYLSILASNPEGFSSYAYIPSVGSQNKIPKRRKQTVRWPPARYFNKILTLSVLPQIL